MSYFDSRFNYLRFFINNDINHIFISNSLVDFFPKNINKNIAVLSKSEFQQKVFQIDNNNEIDALSIVSNKYNDLEKDIHNLDRIGYKQIKVHLIIPSAKNPKWILPYVNKKINNPSLFIKPSKEPPF